MAHPPVTFALDSDILVAGNFALCHDIPVLCHTLVQNGAFFCALQMILCRAANANLKDLRWLDGSQLNWTILFSFPCSHITAQVYDHALFEDAKIKKCTIKYTIEGGVVYIRVWFGASGFYLARETICRGMSLTVPPSHTLSHVDVSVSTMKHYPCRGLGLCTGRSVV